MLGILIVLALAVWIILALRAAKHGSCSCGGSCAGCSGGKCPHCRR